MAFYLWMGVFNMVAVAQLWAFANDLFAHDRGKRLLPVVGVGATLGALIGSGGTAALFSGVGAYPLMLIAAIGMLVPIPLTIAVHRREAHLHELSGIPEDEAEAPIGKRGGFELVLKDRYLFLIAMLVLTFSLVNTLGGFILNMMITDEAARLVATGEAGGRAQRELIGTLAGTVQTWVNLLAFLLQTFVVSRLLKSIGVRGALFVLPIIALGGYISIAALPLLGVVRITKILENSTDYSLQNTTRHALFLPTSREAKYKAKQAIDAFFVRFGDMLQALVVFVGTALAFGVRQFAIVNIVLVVIWLLIATAIVREHRKIAPVEAEEKAA